MPYRWQGHTREDLLGPKILYKKRADVEAHRKARTVWKVQQRERARLSKVEEAPRPNLLSRCR
jgi:hypothetical protein